MPFIFWGAPFDCVRFELADLGLETPSLVGLVEFLELRMPDLLAACFDACFDLTVEVRDGAILGIMFVREVVKKLDRWRLGDFEARNNFGGAPLAPACLDPLTCSAPSRSYIRPVTNCKVVLPRCIMLYYLEHFGI